MLGRWWNHRAHSHAMSFDNCGSGRTYSRIFLLSPSLLYFTVGEVYLSTLLLLGIPNDLLWSMGYVEETVGWFWAQAISGAYVFTHSSWNFCSLPLEGKVQGGQWSQNEKNKGSRLKPNLQSHPQLIHRTVRRKINKYSCKLHRPLTLLLPQKLTYKEI